MEKIIMKDNNNYEIYKLNEEEFRELVVKTHKDKHFKGDPHKMQVDFKTKKTCTDMFGVCIKMEEDIMGFCGIEIFEYKNTKIGFIHCLGVLKEHRGKKLSIDLLNIITDIIKNEYTDVVKIMSTCNPISAKSHEKAGYVITHPGRLSKTGKLMQIKLELML